jgi:hypothetical protein
MLKPVLKFVLKEFEVRAKRQTHGSDRMGKGARETQTRSYHLRRLSFFRAIYLFCCIEAHT